MFTMSKGVTSNSAVCHGKPVVEGTRVLVTTVLGALAGGDTPEMVSEDYGLTAAQISAVLQFAAELADFQVAAYDEVA